MDNLPSQAEILTRLHYDPKWVEYGFITELDLREQFSKYMSGLDENLEHYRYQSFCRSIDSTDIDDMKLDRYIELAQLDEDETMAGAALAHLAKHRGLTERQSLRMKEHPAFAAKYLQSILERTQLLRKLATSGITNDLFEEALSSGDREVQRQLLSNEKISREQLLILAARGSNRSVRNLAKEKAKGL